VRAPRGDRDAVQGEPGTQGGADTMARDGVIAESLVILVEAEIDHRRLRPQERSVCAARGYRRRCHLRAALASSKGVVVARGLRRHR
jgi:hypothetical protein